MKLRAFIYCLFLGGCVGLSLVLSLLVILSWAGGQDGEVTMFFNRFHERLIESIIFPIWTIGGFWASYSLLKRRSE